MRQMGLQGLLVVGLICVAGCLLLGFGLSFIPGQNSPYIDAMTTVLSIVATILMVRRFKEQWLVYTEKRHVFHKQIIADLKERRIPYITLRGSLEERMRKVDEVLAKFRPYHNFFGESIV